VGLPTLTRTPQSLARSVEAPSALPPTPIALPTKNKGARQRACPATNPPNPYSTRRLRGWQLPVFIRDV